MSLVMDLVRAFTQKVAIERGIVQRVYLREAIFAESEGLTQGWLKDGVEVTLFCDQILEAAFRGEKGQYSLKASVRPAKLYNTADDDAPYTSNYGPEQACILATGLSEFDVNKAKRSLTEKDNFPDCLEYCLQQGLSDGVLTKLRGDLEGRTEVITFAQAKQAALDAQFS